MHHHQASDVHMLMKCRSTAEECPIVHADVTGQQTIVGDDDVGPDFAIVADVSPRHQEIFVADLGDTALRAAAMDRAVFTNHVVVSDLDFRVSFQRERKILRRRADNRSMSDEVVGADRDISLNDNV